MLTESPLANKIKIREHYIKVIENCKYLGAIMPFNPNENVICDEEH